MKYAAYTIIAVLITLSGCTLPQSRPAAETGQDGVSDSESPQNEDQPAGGSAAEDGAGGNMLDLSEQGLEKIPEYVFGLENLEELDVSDNRLTGAIQAEIRHLQNLEILDAGNNRITGVPAEIGQLSNLRILDLSDNQITGLPYELGNLENLETLDISGNDWSELDLGIISENLPPGVNIIK